jgi:ribonuclease P protein component
MLGRSNRLTGELNFKRVQEKGWVFQSTNFGIAVFDRKDGEPTRFGFVVSIKVAHDAVDRNYARRKMSEGVRMVLKEVKDGMDIVFLAKPGVVRTSTSEVMKEVGSSLKESGVFK